MPEPVRIRRRVRLYRPPVAAAARALVDTPFRPVSIGGRAIAALVLAGDELTIAIIARGPRGRIGLRSIHTTRCSAITERRQTRIELSDGDRFILAGALKHRPRRRGQPLDLGQHPVSLTARALGMAGTPVATFTVGRQQILTADLEVENR